MSAGRHHPQTPRSLLDLHDVPPDLILPPITAGPPGPGGRTSVTLPGYEGTSIHHVLYLPVDWQPERRWPVIVEYTGNGGYRNRFGDVCTGRVEDAKLGYGLTGGAGAIWIALPTVDPTRGENSLTWWGDISATLDYCRRALQHTCERHGGDAGAVILAGFSRGAIACGYLGLHDDRIADLWRGFFAYSHWDGVREDWPYPGADRASAIARLQRLRGRPCFICQEGGVEETRQYLAESGVEAPYTFVAIGFRNHNDAWILRDVPERRAARDWLATVLQGD